MGVVETFQKQIECCACVSIKVKAVPNHHTLKNVVNACILDLKDWMDMSSMLKTQAADVCGGVPLGMYWVEDLMILTVLDFHMKRNISNAYAGD